MKTLRDERDETFRETKPSDRAEERAKRTIEVATQVESYVNRYSNNVLLKCEENEMQLSRESEHAYAERVREMEILSGLEIDLKNELETETRLKAEIERQVAIVKHAEDETQREKRRTTMVLMLLSRREEEEAEETRREVEHLKEQSIEMERAMRNEIEDRFENKMKMTRQVLEHRVREEEEEARSRWQRK